MMQDKAEISPVDVDATLRCVRMAMQRVEVVAGGRVVAGAPGSNAKVRTPPVESWMSTRDPPYVRRSRFAP